MEVRDYIGTELEHLNQVTARILDGLSNYETLWRSGPGCNSIALLLFHNARFEDMVVQTRIIGKPMIWETGKWYEKCNLAVDEVPFGFTAEQVAAFTVPEFKDLRAYSEAVRAATLACIKNIAPEKLDKVLNMPHVGDITIGSLIALVVVHQAEHVGEMSYIRGLQRGMNK